MHILLAVFVLFLVNPVFAADPIMKNGSCPPRYYSSGGYCVPHNDDTPGAITKHGSCPPGWYSSGNYCVELNNNVDRQAIPKLNGNCPAGWHSSGGYCVKNSN